VEANKAIFFQRTYENQVKIVLSQKITRIKLSGKQTDKIVEKHLKLDPHCVLFKANKKYDINL
jgi:hypothetical protein